MVQRSYQLVSAKMPVYTVTERHVTLYIATCHN